MFQQYNWLLKPVITDCDATLKSKFFKEVGKRIEAYCPSGIPDWHGIVAVSIFSFSF